MGGEQSSEMLYALHIPHKYLRRGKQTFREKTIWERPHGFISLLDFASGGQRIASRYQNVSEVADL